ncbi:MAG TPA: hypothetical protein VH740_15985 [Vicinamibacterales bacterium]
MESIRTSAIAAAFAAASVAIAGQPQDAGPILSAARAALGGTELETIASFTVTGTVAEISGPMTTSSSIEIKCQLPDRFLQRMQRSISRGPLGSFDMTIFEGVNGDEPIHDVVAPGAPFPVWIPAGPAPRTPAEIAAAKAKQARLFKQAARRFLVPLFAAGTGADPLQFKALPQITLSSGPADVVEAAAADGSILRLVIDSSSHRPIRIKWRDRPLVTISRSSSVIVRGGQVQQPPEAPVLPSGDPTVGLPDAEWEIAIDDYRTEDGVTWPHRFTTTFDGKRYREVRLGRFRLNSAIDPKTFAPRR